MAAPGPSEYDGESMKRPKIYRMRQERQRLQARNPWGQVCPAHGLARRPHRIVSWRDVPFSLIRFALCGDCGKEIDP